MPSEKMISRKDDGVGWMIFNNPERHNAISLDMWEAALEIMADILGGGFSSRLFRRLRTQLGYVYGVGANWGAGYTQPGVFGISGSMRSPKSR